MPRISQGGYTTYLVSLSANRTSHQATITKFSKHSLFFELSLFGSGNTDEWTGANTIGTHSDGALALATEVKK